MIERRGRLIVVLGYSDGGQGVLHPICEERLALAAKISTEDDIVVLSGWAKVPGTQSEAELMAAAWSGRARELVVDPDARTTVGNAANARDDVVRTNMRNVVVVTSQWHAARAAAAFRGLLRKTGATITVETVQGGSGLKNRLREVPCWLLLPFQLAAQRSSTRIG